MSDKHFTLDIDPDGLRSVATKLATLKSHIETKAGTVKGTPGDIGDSWWGESVTAQSVVEQLNALDAAVTQINVRINSYGGSVSDGMAIYNALRRHNAKKVVTVDGVAMSSASSRLLAGPSTVAPRSSRPCRKSSMMK